MRVIHALATYLKAGRIPRKEKSLWQLSFNFIRMLGGYFCITFQTHIKNAIVAKDRETYIAGTITLADDTIIPVTNNSIKQGSLYYTNQCTSDDGFSLGHTHRGKQGITIYDDMTNYRAFQGAKMS